MATRSTPFAPGTPCWVDLFTSDPERSQTFYAAVLGWEFEDQGEAYGGYTLARRDGEQVAGLMRNAGESGSPDAWSTYLATAAIDESAARATAAGARMIAPPMPVGELGVMAVLLDPAGALFGLWQADRHTGFTRYNEPGSVSWAEHHSKSFAVTRDFYAEVFGWTYDVTSDTEDFRYLTAKVAGQEVAGLMDSAPVAAGRGPQPLGGVRQRRRRRRGAGDRPRPRRHGVDGCAGHPVRADRRPARPHRSALQAALRHADRSVPPAGLSVVTQDRQVVH